MAHYRTALSSTAPVIATFEHLADFASVADWDPGVVEARLTSGAPGHVGARYAVVAQFGPRRIPLEYEVIAREDPRDEHPGRVVLVAHGGSFSSQDTMERVRLSRRDREMLVPLRIATSGIEGQAVSPQLLYNRLQTSVRDQVSYSEFSDFCERLVAAGELDDAGLGDVRPRPAGESAWIRITWQ